MNEDRSICEVAWRRLCRFSVPLAVFPWPAAVVAATPAAAASAALGGDRVLATTWPMALLATLLASLAFYHLQIFFRRRESAEYLWFAVGVLHLVGIVFLEYWAQELVSSPGLISRSREAAMHLAVPLLIQFSWTLLSRPLRPLLRAYQASHLALAAAMFLIPGPLMTATHAWRWLWGIPGWILLAVVCADALRRGTLEARVIGIGGLALALTGLVGWGGQIAGWDSMLPWPLWIAAVFVLATTLVLSWRFHRIYQDLDELRLRLEEMVEDRTDELEAANDKLHSELAEQRLAEEAMRMLERGVEQSIDGVVVTDLEGK
ncbi:MAG: 7TM diverse intracellular signaling domain-containing protein, partial [Thermoanaerobaculia bacterium]